MPIVLSYHPNDDWAAPGSGAPRLFREHLTALQSRGYRFIGFDDFAALARRRFSDAQRTVLLSTDDGNAENWQVAFPILRELGIPATLFLITDEVTSGAVRPVPGEPGYRRASMTGNPRLRWTEIEQMIASGLVSVQSHTASHFRWGAQLAQPAQLVSHLRADLARSVTSIRERLGVVPQAIAWPWGFSTGTMRALANAAGLQLQFSGTPGINGRYSRPDYLYRVCADGLPTESLLRLSDRLSSPFWGPLYGMPRRWMHLSRFRALELRGKYLPRRFRADGAPDLSDSANPPR
ncbi:MAG TPA: polysaccharide deacetylase family protein [Burkholderiaceae bacterium]|nr:polysaccharide deacetylase family protein [Burkholderiaceae bacterium]